MNFKKLISENPEILDIAMKQITNTKLTEYENMRELQLLRYLNNILSTNKKELKEFIKD